MTMSIKHSLAAILSLAVLPLPVLAADKPIQFDDLANPVPSKSVRFTASQVANSVNKEVEYHGQRHNAELSQRRTSSAGSSGGLTTAGGYQIYKDKGQAAAWEWFKREVVLKCSNGNLPSVYLNKHGKWEAKGSSYSSFEQAASTACN